LKKECIDSSMAEMNIDEDRLVEFMDDCEGFLPE